MGETNQSTAEMKPPVKRKLSVKLNPARPAKNKKAAI